jgi:hypothetical protein
MKCQITGGSAVLTRHCSAFGTWRRRVQEYRVDYPDQAAAQHPVSVTIGFLEPRKRQLNYVTITPGTRYCTIEEAGRLVYDTRTDVPCDMAEFEKERAS